MNNPSSRIIRYGLIMSLVSLISPSYAQTYPSQNIQLIISTTAGDTQDLTGRAIGTELGKILRTTIVPVNKPGAAGAVGADFVVRSKKDGYTILYINSSLTYAYAANPRETPYDPFRDLEPLSSAVSIPLLIAVRSESPWKSIRDLVQHAKQNPEKLTGSSTGVGSVGHFGYEVIRSETGGRIEMIPFKGAAPGIAALLGGHVDVAIPSPTLVLPHVKSGKVRLLLISKKTPDFPGVPTLKELGYKRDMSSVWYGFFLPVGVPAAVKHTLVAALEKSIKSPNLSDTFRSLGSVVDYRDAKEFTKMMSEEYEMVKALLKNVGGS